MARLIVSMNQTLDGYVDHDAAVPDAVLFRHFVDRVGELAGSVYGRRIYEMMTYWDGDTWNEDDPALGDDLRLFAEAWRRQPKWVASRTLKAVGPNATLIEGDVEAFVRRLKTEMEGTIEVAGPELAAGLAHLIDEYQLYIHPVVLGAGKPLFAGPRPPLRLTAHERIGESVIRLTYVPA